MTDDQDYRRVTVGEVARRLDEQREDFRDFKREVIEAIHALQFVPREEYEAAQRVTTERLDKIDRFVEYAQGKPERTLRTLVSDFALPLFAGLVGALATVAAKAKGIA